MKISSRKFPLNAILATMIVSGVSASAVAETESSNTATNTDEKNGGGSEPHSKKVLVKFQVRFGMWVQRKLKNNIAQVRVWMKILAATVPSLDVSSGGRTHSGQNLRGRSIMVMIDGVSLQSVRSISRQLDSIDPFNIERIEVLSGATSVYGAGSSGGVINIVTKKAQSDDLQFESFVGVHQALTLVKTVIISSLSLFLAVATKCVVVHRLLTPRLKLTTMRMVKW